jgi:hypothetical protein
MAIGFMKMNSHSTPDIFGQYLGIFQLLYSLRGNIDDRRKRLRGKSVILSRLRNIIHYDDENFDLDPAFQGDFS